jgi:hypothetical protein
MLFLGTQEHFNEQMLFEIKKNLINIEVFATAHFLTEILMIITGDPSAGRKRKARKKRKL